MKTRVIPCTECRNRRRKCIQLGGGNICMRCNESGLNCIQAATKKKNHHNREVIQTDYNELHNQIADLEWTIQQLEWQINKVEEGGSGEAENQIMCLNSTKDRQDNNILAAMSSVNWQIKIKNGHFQIETGIRNLGDLLPLFSDARISYLSPLGGNYSEYDTDSSSSSSGSVYYGQSRFLIQFGSAEKEAKNNRLMFSTKLFSGCAVEETKRLEILCEPKSLYQDYTIVIDCLVRKYFSCHNSMLPLFHEETFMKQYRQMEDPTNNLLCLSFACLVSIASTCDHFHFFHTEDKRTLAEFFYRRATVLLKEQFDDPDKKLENIMAINLLTNYLQILLRIKECFQLAQLAYPMCLELGREYELIEAVYSNDLSENSAFKRNSPCSVTIRPVTEHNVNYTLYSRHVSIALSTEQLLCNLINTNAKNARFEIPYWQVLEDESITTRKYVYAQNWFIKLITHPFILRFQQETAKVQLGSVCTLSFESLVRLDDIVAEWNASTPDEYRLCNGYLDEERCIQAIADTTDFIKLFSYIHYQMFNGIIHSSFLKLSAVNQEATEILPYVLQHSTDRILGSSRLILMAIRRIIEADTISHDNGHSAYTLRVYIQFTTDLLINLSFSSDPKIAQDARLILREALNEFDNIELRPHENYVPRGLSPIFFGTFDLNDVSTFNMEVYDKYPNPWLAVVNDACNYVCSL